MSGTLAGNLAGAVAIVAGSIILTYLLFRWIEHINNESNKTPTVVILLLVRNQEQIIEGVLREIYACAADKKVKVCIVDKNSEDQTPKIIECFKRTHPQLCEMEGSLSEAAAQQGGIKPTGREIIYCIDLTRPVNFRLLHKTIHSILKGKDTCLYRTRLMG